MTKTDELVYCHNFFNIIHKLISSLLIKQTLVNSTRLSSMSSTPVFHLCSPTGCMVLLSTMKRNQAYLSKVIFCSFHHFVQGILKHMHVTYCRWNTVTHGKLSIYGDHHKTFSVTCFLQVVGWTLPSLCSIGCTENNLRNDVTIISCPN